MYNSLSITSFDAIGANATVLARNLWALSECNCTPLPVTPSNEALLPTALHSPRMADDGFIMTIDSDDEDASAKVSKAKDATEEAQLNPDFTFDVSADPYADFLDEASRVDDTVEEGSKPVSSLYCPACLLLICMQRPISVDDIIERRKAQRATGKRKRDQEENDESEDEEIEDEDEEDEDGDEDDEELSDGEEEFVGLDDDEADDPLASSDEGEANEDDDENAGSEEDQLEGQDAAEDNSSDDDSEEETQAEKDRKAAFFAEEQPAASAKDPSSFVTMNLSRPIIKAITALNFSKPTPIQAATIPVALLGKDVVGNAVTGSGKTAAFIIPMLERLLYRERGKNAAATRCLILVPTRELGVQCYEVGIKLAKHTDIRFCLVVGTCMHHSHVNWRLDEILGGLSLKAQEATLRTRPDVIIATPGRLIDHIRNTPSFTLDALDILVLDEADRMLSDGFADELTEIIKSCPTSRQTMLFSATMTDSVDELVKMSLNKPVRLFVDPKRSTARGLVQEFVRVRAGKEAERSALLASLCKRTFKSGVIVFFRSKKLAHQMRIVFRLLGMRCDELHGDLTQEQVCRRPHRIPMPVTHRISSDSKRFNNSATDQSTILWPPISLHEVLISKVSRLSSTTICPGSSRSIYIVWGELLAQAGKDGEFRTTTARCPLPLTDM